MADKGKKKAVDRALKEGGAPNLAQNLRQHVDRPPEQSTDMAHSLRQFVDGGGGAPAGAAEKAMAMLAESGQGVDMMEKARQNKLDQLSQQAAKQRSSQEEYSVDLPSKAAEAPHQGEKTSSTHGDFGGYINEAAQKYDLDPALIEAVIEQESGFQPDVTSHAGAQGLMQLMPGTAEGLGVSDPFNPQQNIDGGARYLRQMIDQFGDIELALAAYNAGPGNVQKHDGIPPFEETQNYVPSVLNRWEQRK